MNLDDDACYCYHVPLRKLVHFTRRTRPSRASQLSGCLGAGTGCGWCIPLLQRIFHSCRDLAEIPPDIAQLSTEDYAADRSRYRRSGGVKNTFGDQPPSPSS